MRRADRRRALRWLGALLLAPLALAVRAARAARPEASFAAEGFERALAALPGQGEPVASEAVRIELPALAEDGSAVALEVRTDLPEVRSLSVFGDRNPVPLIARLELGPEVLPEIGMRIKLAESSHVVVVVESADGRYLNRRRVEVARGGCL